MKTFVTQLRAEISRSTKRELRSESKSLKQTISQQRSQIADLKKRILSLEKALKTVVRQLPKPQKIEAKPVQSSLRFRAKGFASLRKKLGLSANQMGQLIGVSAQSIYHWEIDKSRPRASQMPAIAAARKLTKASAAKRLGLE